MSSLVAIFPIAGEAACVPDLIARQAFLNLCDMSIDSMYELTAFRKLLVRGAGLR